MGCKCNDFVYYGGGCQCGTADKKFTLWVCTLYKSDIDRSIYMQMNIDVLEYYLDNTKVVPMFVKAGVFEKGSPDDLPDDEEVKWRNQYLHHVPDGDFLLILDTDEQLCGVVGMIEDCMTKMVLDDVVTCFVAEVLPYQIKSRPRLLRKMPGMIYERKHDVIMWAGRNVLDPYMADCLKIEAHAIQFSHHVTDRVDVAMIKDAMDKISAENKQKMSSGGQIQLFARVMDLKPTEPNVLPVPGKFNDPDEEVLLEHGMDCVLTWGDDIRKNGIKYCLAVEKDGTISDGNGRYWCALDIGMEFVPVNFEYMSGINKRMYPKREVKG